MSIRWLYCPMDSEGKELDVRLMTLHDIWVEIWKKDKAITYAWLAEWFADQGYSPVAIDDKQKMYFAIYFGRTEDSRYVNGKVFTALTGEQFYEMVYQPFGTDELLIRSPIVYPIGLVTPDDLATESVVDVIERPSPNILKQLKGLFSE